MLLFSIAWFPPYFAIKVSLCFFARAAHSVTSRGDGFLFSRGMVWPATIASVGAPNVPVESAKRDARASNGIILETKLQVVELAAEIHKG